MTRTYSGTEQEFKNLDLTISNTDNSLPTRIDGNIITQGYQIFLMSQLAIEQGVIDEDMSYDEMYAEACVLYSKFKQSLFNGVGRGSHAEGDNGSEYDCIVSFLHFVKEREIFKKEVRELVCEIFTKIGLDLPNNIDDIVKYCISDVEDTADQSDWSDSDVHIAFRRWCEGENRVD